MGAWKSKLAFSISLVDSTRASMFCWMDAERLSNVPPLPPPPPPSFLADEGEDGGDDGGGDSSPLSDSLSDMVRAVLMGLSGRSMLKVISFFVTFVSMSCQQFPTVSRGRTQTNEVNDPDRKQRPLDRSTSFIATVSFVFFC